MSKGESPLVDSPHDRRADDTPAPKERITVNLTGKGAGALTDLVKRTGHSKTDVINRALTLYEFFESVMDEGGAVFVRRAGSDEPERVHFL